MPLQVWLAPLFVLTWKWGNGDYYLQTTMRLVGLLHIFMILCIPSIASSFHLLLKPNWVYSLLHFTIYDLKIILCKSTGCFSWGSQSTWQILFYWATQNSVGIGVSILNLQTEKLRCGKVKWLSWWHKEWHMALEIRYLHRKAELFCWFTLISRVGMSYYVLCNLGV